MINELIVTKNYIQVSPNYFIFKSILRELSFLNCHKDALNDCFWIKATFKIPIVEDNKVMFIKHFDDEASAVLYLTILVDAIDKLLQE